MALFYVYVLLSQVDKKFYTGYTENLYRRLEEHNAGKVTSTKYRKPFELIYYEVCLNKDDALHREKYLKTTYGKRYIRNRLKYYLDSIS
jgi:putative endonuclease